LQSCEGGVAAKSETFAWPRENHIIFSAEKKGHRGEKLNHQRRQRTNCPLNICDMPEVKPEGVLLFDERMSRQMKNGNLTGRGGVDFFSWAEKRVGKRTPKPSRGKKQGHRSRRTKTLQENRTRGSQEVGLIREKGSRGFC